MYSQLFDITGRLISCIVSTLIFFRYFDARYERKYPQSYLYIVGKVICCVFNFFIYLFNVPALNMLYWSVVIIFLGSFLYCECNISKMRYHLTNVSFSANFLFIYSIINPSVMLLFLIIISLTPCKFFYQMHYNINHFFIPYYTKIFREFFIFS